MFSFIFVLQAWVSRCGYRTYF